MAKQLFGTDGIRGIPGEYPLDDNTLIRTGIALGDYLRKAGLESHLERELIPRTLTASNWLQSQD